MKISHFLYFIPVFLLAGSYHSKHAPSIPDVPDIHVIELWDDVKLHMQGKGKHGIKVGDGVRMVIQDGLMKLTADYQSGSHHGERVVYYSRPDNFKNIQEIRLYGHAELKGQYVNAPFVLRNNSTGDIYINGYVPLQLLDQRGTGNVRIDWVNSDQLELSMHSGKVALAGIAEHIRYRGKNRALLDARNLRAKNLWAMGKGHSIAFFMPTQQSHTITEEDAQIVLMHKTLYSSTLTSGKGELIYGNMFTLLPGA